jgi:cell wall-associated NlpC family hydrolase
MRIMSCSSARLPGVTAILLLAAGCAGTPARDQPPGGERIAAPVAPARVEPGAPENSPASPIVKLALSQVGVKYRYGGSHPSEGFDCSGLVYYTYSSNGHVVPRTSREQYGASRRIPLEDAAEGDLVFFSDQEKLSHVGIYLGDGRFVHAPSSGGAVRVAELDSPYYQRHLVGVGRLLP